MFGITHCLFTLLEFISFKDSWSSVSNIINHYGKIQDTLIAAAGPGHFNDPDMVLFFFSPFLIK